MLLLAGPTKLLGVLDLAESGKGESRITTAATDAARGVQYLLHDKAPQGHQQAASCACLCKRLLERTLSNKERYAMEVEDNYWKSMTQLLSHLADRAPALRGLALVPPRSKEIAAEVDYPVFELLPLIGALSWLEWSALP